MISELSEDRLVLLSTHIVSDIEYKQKNAFDLDRLINRRRRPGLNEACTMYEVTVPDDALTEEDEDILNYDDIDDPDAFA